MNTKGHRVVLNRDCFQRIAHLQNEGAVECAENEGWPIVVDPHEAPDAVAAFAVLGRAARVVRQHFDDEVHFWSGRSEAQRRVRVVASHGLVARPACACTGA
jgi:hypothetical protein